MSADPAGISGPVDPQGTPGGGSPPGNPLAHQPTLPPELADGWPDPVQQRATMMPEVREARKKHAAGGVVRYPTESVRGSNEIVMPRVIELPMGADGKQVEIHVAPLDRLKNMIHGALSRKAAPVEQVVLAPQGVRVRVLCTTCGGRIQVEKDYASLKAGPSHSMHGRRGRLVEIHVGGRCCGDELYAKVPVWLEDDWLGP